MGEGKRSMGVRCPSGTKPTDPGKSVVELGTTEGTEVCLCTIGMRACGILAADVVIDANFFPIWSTEGSVGNLCPCWLAIREFCNGASVSVVFADRVVQFTAEYAADRVTM